MSRVAFYLWLVTLATCDSAASEEKDGILEKIKAGLESAKNYLETAKDIANLVSKSLGHKHKEKRGEDGNENQQQTFGPSNIISAFLRLLGLDSQKVAAIAVNSVIFLAQMISSLFDINPPDEKISRNIEDDDAEHHWDMLRFILENKNERIQNLIEKAQDTELPNQLMEKVDGLDSSCIRLLLCKTSPVIRAAQNSLRNKAPSSTRLMTEWLPSREEFEMNSDECEDKHTDCNIFSD
ncbi:hypothetical protein KM043_018420 [Ampulex compressa]|nr:hypothetical protein KM043_018420 [Ampulex compressa]